MEKFIAILLVFTCFIIFIGIVYWATYNTPSIKYQYFLKVKKAEKVELAYDWAYENIYDAWDAIYYTNDFGKTYHFAFYDYLDRHHSSKLAEVALLMFFCHTPRDSFKEYSESKPISYYLEKYPRFEDLKPHIQKLTRK